MLDNLEKPEHMFKIAPFLFLLLLVGCKKNDSIPIDDPIVIDTTPMVNPPKLQPGKYPCTISMESWSTIAGVTWDSTYQGEVEVILHANYDTLTFKEVTRQLNRTVFKRSDLSNSDYYFYQNTDWGSVDLPTADLYVVQDSCVVRWRQGGLSGGLKTLFAFKY